MVHFSKFMKAIQLLLLTMVFISSPIHAGPVVLHSTVDAPVFQMKDGLLRVLRFDTKQLKWVPLTEAELKDLAFELNWNDVVRQAVLDGLARDRPKK